jgi:hypothetical protein
VSVIGSVPGHLRGPLPRPSTHIDRRFLEHAA